MNYYYVQVLATLVPSPIEHMLWMMALKIVYILAYIECFIFPFCKLTWGAIYFVYGNFVFMF